MTNNYLTTYLDKNNKKHKRSTIGVVRILCFSFIKFVFDELFSFILLIITLPIFILIAMAIKIDSNGPVFFKQKRVGKNGKEFTLLKFRSMVKDNNMLNFKSKDQLTKVGLFLRKTSLDELPQLINVLKGDMSFIGPRPWIKEYYDVMNNTQKHRSDVKPGITGLAQVNGRKALDIISRIDYDLYYIEVYSLWLDVKILIKTIAVMFRKNGINRGKDEIKDNINLLKKYNRKDKNEKKKNN